MRAGVGAGIVTGLALLIILGWVPVIGALVAGYTMGLHTEDRKDAATMGFVAGAIAAFVLVWVFYSGGTQVFVVSEGPLAGVAGNFFTFIYSLGPLVLIGQTAGLAILGSVLGSESRRRWAR
ncbi:MAG: hypothetical protein M1286_03205 [Candidatus Marsarchaeota archaeon]|nr:hypothetical protein [Candidatus Marsarchaeota archaeon]